MKARTTTLRPKLWGKCTLAILALVFALPLVASPAYADNCSSLGDCFTTLAIVLAVIAALAIIIAGLLALPAILAALGSGGGLFALVGGGTLGGAGAATAISVLTNIAINTATAAAGAAVAGELITMMSSQGTPGNNQAQNKQFNQAVREAERKLGRQLSKGERRQVHDAISKQNYGFREIVEEILGMFGGG